MSVIKINLNEDNNVTNTITNNNINNVVNNSQSSQKNTKADKLKYMAQFSEFNEFEKDYREQYGELWKNAKQYNAKQQTEIINITIGKAAMHLGLLWDWIRDDRYLFGFYRKGSNNKDMIIKVPYDFKFKTLHDKIMDWYKKIKDGKNQKKPSIVVNETFNNDIQSQEDNINNAIDDLAYIQFEDPEVKRICHKKLHVYTYEDAKKIIKLDKKSGFLGSNITSFNELKYFTNLQILERTFGACTYLKQITLPNSVIIIGKNAFDNCKSLQQINIPNNVIAIGNFAFWDCEQIQKINLPNSVTTIGVNAFEFCSLLNEINIPNSITEIGDAAFSDCRSLVNINIPNSVTKIGDEVFENCSNLQMVTILSENPSLGYSIFYGCESLRTIYVSKTIYEKYKDTDFGKYLKIIKKPLMNETFNNDIQAQEDNIDNAINDMNLIHFKDPNMEKICHEYLHVYSYEDAKNCTNIRPLENVPYELANKVNFFKELKYFTNIKEIPDYTFCGYPVLSIIELPLNLKTIGRSAFTGCLLQKIDIPSSVTTIKENAFSDNKMLKKIIFHEGLQTIGNRAFTNNICQTIKIPDTVVSIGSHSFSQCDKLRKISFGINSQLDTISEKCFSWCQHLKEVILPKNLKTIGYAAFNYCKLLKNIELPEGLKTIDDLAFEDSGIIDIRIPQTVTSIGKQTFAYCHYLKNIYAPGHLMSQLQYVIDKVIETPYHVVNETFNGQMQSERGTMSDDEWKKYQLDKLTKNLDNLIKSYLRRFCESEITETDKWGNSETYGTYDYDKFLDDFSEIIEQNTNFRFYGKLRIKDYGNKLHGGNHIIGLYDDIQGYAVKRKLDDFWYHMLAGYRRSSILDFIKLIQTMIKNILPNQEDIDKVTEGLAKKYTENYKNESVNESVNNDKEIHFKDKEIEKICHEKLHVYTYEDAKKIKKLKGVFRNNSIIKSFDEFKYFTGLKTLQTKAFENCKNLETITIPNSITNLGNEIFYGRDKLKRINVPKNLYDEMKERYGDIVKKYQYKYSISKNLINETFNNDIQSQKDDINDAIENISKIDAYKFKDDLKFELENYVDDLEENDLGVIEQYKLGVTIPLSDYLNSFPRNCNEIYLNIDLSIRNQYEAKLTVNLMSENDYYYLQLDPSDPKKGSEKSFSLNARTDNNLFRLIHFLFNEQTRPGQNIECADFYIVQKSVHDIIQFFIANSKNKWFVSLLSDDALNDMDDILWEDSDNIEYFHAYGYINDEDYNDWKISNEDLN